MGLIADAEKMWRERSSDLSEFGVALSFVAPEGETASIVGLHTKHHLSFNTEGIAVNSRNAHVSVSEKLLTDLDYPTRNSNGEVTMKNHRVTCKDSTGEEKTYVVREWWQNETIGVIVMVLGEWR
jgi:hypothetical protein